MAAAPAAPACIYDAPIAPAELQHQGFGFPIVPVSKFTFNWTFNRRSYDITLYKTHDNKYFTMDYKPFNPNYFKDNKVQFNAYANNPANLYPFTDAITEMTRIGGFPLGYEYAALQQTQFNIFCARSSESLLRMKLFCAFGMLHNFTNHSKIKLMVRGGMGLRLQLGSRSELIPTAPETDMDGLIIVDRSIGPAELDQFKTTFMKLLVLSIKSSIPHNATLTCKPAGGDSKNTIKLLVKTAVVRSDGVVVGAAEYELGDIGFKYSDDEIVKIYEKDVSIMTPEGMRDVNGIFPMRVQVYPGFLQCVWNFPNIENMKSEYEHVVGKLRENIDTIEEAKSKSPESRLFDADSPFDDEMNLRKLGREVSKFATKSEIAERRYGGKKRTMKRRTHKRGGSTTEQIGAAAQMRAFLPRHSATRNALNHIVHHESNNRFHDANYRHSPATQTAINKAFRTINANPRVSRRTKKQMKIAKQKALTRRG